MTLSTEALARALAEEEAWLTESPKRCQVCGHRDCFHVEQYDQYDCEYEVCLVGECTCDGTVIVAPPVAGTYGETVFASGETKATAFVDLFGGAKPDRVPGVEFEVIFGDDTKEST